MSGSTMLMAVSSSGAVTITGELSGSDAANALLLSGTGSVGFTTTSSFLAVSSSQQEVSASYISLSGSYNTFSGSASTRITENSSSIQQVSSSLLQVSASYISLSGSYNTFSGSASTRITVDSASLLQVSSSQQQISASLLNVISIFATTGSNSFRATQSITGSLTVTGQIIAQTLNVQQVTSSIIYSSGSNNFGCDLNSRQTFTGSVLITGSLTIAGASSAASYSGTTIYGSTAVCSPVGKFTSCIDAGSGIFSSSVTSTQLSVNTTNTTGKINIQGPNDSGLLYLFNSCANARFMFNNYYGYGIDAMIIQEFNTSNVLQRDIIAFATCGKVGIGCSTPGYTLDVNGTGHFRADGSTMLIESTQPTNSHTLKIVQCADGGNGNTDQGLVVQINGADGTSNIANFYDYNNGTAISRVRFLKNGVTCFQNTVCTAGHVSSEDVRIYRSAGVTTGYINFGSTGTNYLGFDGTRFSINGSINAGGATFSDTGDTCLVLRTSNSGNPRFKFCGGGGVFNRSTAADVMYFGESSDTGLYLFRGGTLMSDKGACTGTYGFTHCGAGKWGRIGLPNTSYMYLETNATAGVYVDAPLYIGGNVCSSGQVKGTNLNAAGPICGSGFRSGASSGNSGGYTSDGLWGATATPNYIHTTSAMGLLLGYTDNGSGLYGPAYGFDVAYKDGLNNCIDYNAIIMRNSGQGTTPFRVTSYGNIYGNSKNFRIKHPIPSMNDTHYLIHTSIEGPQADLIYRGKVQLVNGKAEVNIDLASRMTDGTFEALCQDVQSYTTNESGWSLTKSYVVENILHIEAQDETSHDTISWLVIGERNDDGIKNSAITDEYGHVIVEELKPEEGL